MSNQFPKVSLNKKHESVIEILKQNNPQTCVAFARGGFTSGRTRSMDFRRKQLLQFQKLINENEDRLTEALGKDFKKPRHESLVYELDFVRNDIRNVLWNLKKWTSPRVVHKKLIFIFDKATVYNDPLGVVLIIGNWNHPIQSCLLPVASCIAAGNCFIIKPSTVARHTAQVLADIIPQYLDQSCYHVYLGHKKEILVEKFDYIFYSGGENLGAVVCKAAAVYKTPVTVVLGGKNPVYIDETADIDIAVRRLIWGKCVNAGQACIAPEYILCSKEVEMKFLEAVEAVVKEFYTEDPKNSSDYSKIVSENHFDKLVSIIDNNNVAFGGNYDKKEMYISPTILTDVPLTSEIFNEELYGPVMVIVTVCNVEQAIKIINSRSKPLSMYIFSQKRKDIKRILENTSAGGVTINDTMMHWVIDDLPYGGVGDSGMGKYHGRATFESLVHKKSVFHRTQFSLLEKMQFLRYPPYKKFKTTALQILLRKYRTPSLSVLADIFLFVLGVVVGTVLICIYYFYVPLKCES